MPSSPHLTLSVDDARARVAVGMAFLDRTKPDWWRRINPHLLDMQHSCLCVLGQVCGGFYETVGWLQQDNPRYAEAEARGFWISCNDWDYNVIRASYRTLQDAWIEAIADRVVLKSEVRDVAQGRESLPALLAVAEQP